MELKFKFVDEKDIKIIAVENEIEKEVGCIFTPSGSSKNTKNAIQICGISEVFEFWGCSRYIQPINLNSPPKRIIDALKDRKEEFIQMKDIQVMFEFETIPSNRRIDFNKDCLKCFNNPCTCEVKINRQNPYVIKTFSDIKDKLQFKEDEKEHSKPKYEK